MEEFRLRYPFRNGQLNWAVQKGADTDSDGYQSAFELANDLECIWSSAVVDIVKIPQSEWKVGVKGE